MTGTRLEELVRTLLYEGYALYPYTPGATKNATPTPFGIVYPPAHAAGSPTTFDHSRLQVVVEVGRTDARAMLTASARFLEPSGERHEAVERRVDLPPTPLAELAEGPIVVPFATGVVHGHLRATLQPLHAGLHRFTLSVHNETGVDPPPGGLDRARALRSSLLSTHLVATLATDPPGAARFVSPVDPPEHAATANMTCTSVNTFPVLAADEDDAVLGAAIILPDHPQIAPESRGDLFDGTEIEEALLLHVLALSEGEVDEIAGQDPAIREMVRRAAEATPEDIVRLHGRVTVSPAADAALSARIPAYGDELKGERELAVDGVVYRLGDHVRLRGVQPGGTAAAHAQDHLLDGRIATIERIYVDHADGVHLCVTVDDDPGQALMREIGRYLYFKPTEVEVLA